MWTPCDEPIEEYNEETGKMETRYHCPYTDTYTGYEDEMCRNCCGLGVDEKHSLRLEEHLPMISRMVFWILIIISTELKILYSKKIKRS